MYIVGWLQTQNQFLQDYVDRRGDILLQLLRHDALPDTPSCYRCGINVGIYRCQDCFNRQLSCQTCCVSDHSTSPFHRITKWNGMHFERSDLHDLGLFLELSHGPTECHPSDNDIPASSDDGDDAETSNLSGSLPSTAGCAESNLTLIASTGIFVRRIRWCKCASPSAHRDRRANLLLGMKLFPVSFRSPETAFTFEVLDHFRVDALECKTAAMNFMSKLRRMTNEAFPNTVPVSHNYRTHPRDSC